MRLYDAHLGLNNNPGNEDRNRQWCWKRYSLFSGGWLFVAQPLCASEAQSGSFSLTMVFNYSVNTGSCTSVVYYISLLSINIWSKSCSLCSLKQSGSHSNISFCFYVCKMYFCPCTNKLEIPENFLCRCLSFTSNFW